jgi:hypothetical protein
MEETRSRVFEIRVLRKIFGLESVKCWEARENCMIRNSIVFTLH